MNKKADGVAETPKPVVDQDPQEGGSYLRQPDGSLKRVAPAPAAEPETKEQD